MKNNNFFRIRNWMLHGLEVIVVIVSVSISLGFQVWREASRLDALTIHDPSNVSTIGIHIDTLNENNLIRLGWNSFRASNGWGWNIYIDARSGAPLLVEGQGIALIPGSGNALSAPSAVTLEYLEGVLRQFLRENTDILMAKDSELVLNRNSSLKLTRDVWQIVFDRAISGIPVAGDHYFFSIGHGNLISFGAPQWSMITTDPAPSLPADNAFQILRNYMGLAENERVDLLNSGELLFIPRASSGNPHDPYNGNIGEGYSSSLAWKFRMRVIGEPGTWIGIINAHSGAVLAFFDDDQYAQMKGGIYPESNDGVCPSGCEQPDYPMPYADISIGQTSMRADTMGMFECAPAGSSAATTLSGTFVDVNDGCGGISDSAICDNDLDLEAGGGTDCAIPEGSSPGDTHASRTSYYHLNRAMEIARYWLPDNAWLRSTIINNVNWSGTCGAYWSGALYFYRSGSGCGNAAEIAGIVLHEWGHGFDQNDGGGYSNPSNAYADASEFMYDHTSCIGRGFWTSQQCGGYGNPCLDCTGARDMDWNKRADHQPSTPANWADHCSSGSGPCGREDHCEGYIGGETVWDLAARDLPSFGYDQSTAWHIMDRLWYQSRGGSSGNAYNCSLPNSDGCITTSWFSRLKNIDDDDGNLNNGTPHAAAIFAAFNRHNIACGAESDASNQNYAICPSIGPTSLSGTPGFKSASLSWTPVPNASEYLILRNDVSCDWSFSVVAEVPASDTTYTDNNIANDFAEHYRVVPAGANSACFGPASNCVEMRPTASAGSIQFDRAQYRCDNDAIAIAVRDSNVGASSLTVTISSTMETSPETIILNETFPGSAIFTGTIGTTSAPAAADGILSLGHGDAITGRYIDADDGSGGTNIVRETAALADCINPGISNVLHKDIYDNRATITWMTEEISNSAVHYGQSKPPDQQDLNPALVTDHTVLLDGLQECTTYYYAVSSSDAAGNIATDDNSGQYFRFETLRYDPQSGYGSCHAGKVYLDRGSYSCNDIMSIRLLDMDLNKNGNVAETAMVSLTSTSEIAPEKLTLTETGPDTADFRGTIQTASGIPVPDGRLQVGHGETITVAYHDADDGTGASAISFVTATTDCSGPFFSNLTVTDSPPFKVTIVWNTSEPSTSAIDYGATTALGKHQEDGAFKTLHSFEINDMDLCQIGYFRISGTDERGNSRMEDKNGQLYTFETGSIPTAVMVEGFEKDDHGWSLNGEWQVTAPQGKGRTCNEGYPDPSSAFMGSRVLGTDLTGLGSYSGDYEPNITTPWEAVSPEMNVKNLANARLIFERWLNVHSGMYDKAGIYVYKNGWQKLYENLNSVYDATWSEQLYDISAYAANNSRFRIKFIINSNADTQLSGWNIDNVIVKDGTAPGGEPCGGCAGKPSFAGLKSILDLDACADSGISLFWDAAPAWGSGSNGTYAVYRDTIPNFIPSSSNLIASGLTSTSYIDQAAPNNITLYYLALAENNESCSSGPANGGVTDENEIYLSAIDSTSQSAPGDVGSSVRIQKINDVHLRLSWNPAPDAASYTIYRADNKQMNGAERIGLTTDLFYDDPGEIPEQDCHYYKVKAVNACGEESP